MLDPATPAFRIANLSTLWLTVHAFERDAVRIGNGASAQDHVPGTAGPGLPRHCRLVGGQVERESRTVPVRIDVRNAGRPAASRHVGDGAAARRRLGRPILTVPVAAVQRVRNEWCVFLPKDAGTFEIRPIGRGRDLAGEVEILSGLTRRRDDRRRRRLPAEGGGREGRGGPRCPLRSAMISRLIRASFHAPLLTVAPRRSRRRSSARSGCRTCGATSSRTCPRRCSTSSCRTRRWAPRSWRPPSRSRSRWRSPACPTFAASARTPSSASRRSRSSSSRDADYYRSRQFVAERVAQVGRPAAARHRAAAHLEPDRPAERDLRVHARSGTRRRRSDDAARSGRVRGQEPAARRAGRGGRRAARRIPAPVPGAARSGAHVRAPGQPRRGAARGRGVERERLGRLRRAGTDRVDRARGRPRARPSTTCGSTVVTVRGDVPVLLGDVADVREAPAVRRGIAHRLNGEVVSARVIKQFGADTVQVAAGIRAGGRRHPARPAEGRPAADRLRPVGAGAVGARRRRPRRAARRRLRGARDLRCCSATCGPR